MATAPSFIATASFPRTAPASAVAPPLRRERASDIRGCVLLVDSDRCIVEAFSRTLRSARVEVVPTLRGRSALALSRRIRFDLILLNLRLEDMSALDVLRGLRGQGMEAPVIAIGAPAAHPLAIEAVALGADRVLEEPVRLAELRDVVVRATRAMGAPLDVRVHTPRLPEISPPRTAAERWCNFVMRLVSCPHDLKTNAEWARYTGVSGSVMRESCRQVHIQPHDARDFARMLRAVHRSGRQWTPESVLDVSDGRTLHKLEERSGLSVRHDGRTPTLEQFFDRQQWIPQENAALLVVRALLLG